MTHFLKSLSFLVLGLILQQSWLIGALAYAFAYGLGETFYPMFPRRVVITPTIALLAPAVTLAVVTLASILGLVHVMRLDPARALEG